LRASAIPALLWRLTDIPVARLRAAKVCPAAAARSCAPVSRFDKIYLLPYSFRSAWLAFRAALRGGRGIAKDGRESF